MKRASLGSGTDTKQLIFNKKEKQKNSSKKSFKNGRVTYFFYNFVYVFMTFLWSLS